MSGGIAPFPQYAFMAWCLVKDRYFILCIHFTALKGKKRQREAGKILEYQM
jgi:hypothetical protein